MNEDKSLTAEDLRRILGIPASWTDPSAFVPARPAEPAKPSDDDEQDEDDIVSRLRAEGIPCRRCDELANEAADEIERLRTTAGLPDVQASPLLCSLDAAIRHSDPCGRPDCVAVSGEFLSLLRDEILCLRRSLALSGAVALWARRAWRDDSRTTPTLASLMDALKKFEESLCRDAA